MLALLKLLHAALNHGAAPAPPNSADVAREILTDSADGADQPEQDPSVPPRDQPHHHRHREEDRGNDR